MILISLLFIFVAVVLAVTASLIILFGGDSENGK